MLAQGADIISREFLPAMLILFGSKVTWPAILIMHPLSSPFPNS